MRKTLISVFMTAILLSSCSVFLPYDKGSVVIDLSEAFKSDENARNLDDGDDFSYSIILENEENYKKFEGKSSGKVECKDIVPGDYKISCVIIYCGIKYSGSSSVLIEANRTSSCTLNLIMEKVIANPDAVILNAAISHSYLPDEGCIDFTVSNVNECTYEWYVNGIVQENEKNDAFILNLLENKSVMIGKNLVIVKVVRGSEMATLTCTFDFSEDNDEIIISFNE